MSGIPFDVIQDILPHVAVKDLLRFRCVSKLFQSFIDSPDFIKIHASHPPKSSTGNICGLFEYVKLDDPRLFILDLNRSDDCISEVMLKPPSCCGGSPYPKRVLGLCNGLVALIQDFRWPMDIILWNPLTRETRKVPSLDGVHRNSIIAYGFGYDPNTDDYKLVGICFSKYHGFDSKVMIYSLKSNSWKEIVEDWFSITNLKGMHSKTGVLVNNALHWVVFNGNGNRKIVAFDLVKEEFRFVPVFESMECYSRWDIRLSVLDGCLILTCNDYQRFYVWVMKEYGVQRSWTELLSCLRFTLGIFRDRCNSIPLTYSRGRDKVLLNSFFTLVWYDLVSEKIESYHSYPDDVPNTFALSFVALNETKDEIRLKRKQI